MNRKELEGSRSGSYARAGWIGLALLGCLLATNVANADDWPQWLGPKRDGVWREKGIIKKMPDKLIYKWRTKIGAGYSGPAVADGRVYITDRVLPKGVRKPTRGFGIRVIPGKERVLCLNEKTGKILWKKEYDCPYRISYAAGPRCTPVVAGDKVYTLGAMGDLYCWKVKDGSIVWQKNLPKIYGVKVPLWGFAGHPLIDGDRLICLVGGANSTAVAFNKDTGKEIWKAVTTSNPGYAPPMIYEIAGMRQLIIWHPGGIHALNPKNGKEYWSHKHRRPLKAALSIPTPRYDPKTRRLFVTAFYNGPLMLVVDKNGKGARVLWRGQSSSEQPERTDGLHSIMATPFIKNGTIYGVCSYGELRGLDAATGKRLWYTRKPTANGKSVRWANAFLVEHEDKFFLFNELGDLILAKLSPAKYEAIGRINVLPPTNPMAGFRGRRLVLWSHPAFANQSMYARNDNEIVRISLAAKDYSKK